MEYVNQLLVRRHPYVVLGPGLDVATGVPRCLKKPGSRPWWDKPGAGTAFRIESLPHQGPSLNLFWGFDDRLHAELPDEPVATGTNTVPLLDLPGAFLIQGMHAEGQPIHMQFDAAEITYRWSARCHQAVAAEERAVAPIETLVLTFIHTNLS